MTETFYGIVLWAGVFSYAPWQFSVIMVGIGALLLAGRKNEK